MPTHLQGDEIQQAAAALILIDVINDFDFPEAEQLLEHAISAADRIRALKARAKETRRR